MNREVLTSNQLINFTYYCRGKKILLPVVSALRARDRQTDGRTDGHVAIAITRASIASRG